MTSNKSKSDDHDVAVAGLHTKVKSGSIERNLSTELAEPHLATFIDLIRYDLGLLTHSANIPATRAVHVFPSVFHLISRDLSILCQLCQWRPDRPISLPRRRVHMPFDS